MMRIGVDIWSGCNSVWRVCFFFVILAEIGGNAIAIMFWDLQREFKEKESTKYELEGNGEK